jgi:hypothetical protein
MSVKSRHLLLFLYKISIRSLHFCQLFATCFSRLPGLTRQSRSDDLPGYLSRTRTRVSLRGPIPYCMVDGRAVPRRFVFLCTRKKTGNATGTNFSDIPKSPSSSGPYGAPLQAALQFPWLIPRSCLVGWSAFRLLPSVAAVLCRPQRGWLAVSVFPSLKCFTHLLTLLAPVQTSPYTPRSRS